MFMFDFLFFVTFSNTHFAVAMNSRLQNPGLVGYGYSFLNFDNLYSISPLLVASGVYVPSPPADPKYPKINDAVLKYLCMYTLKYASQTHFKDSLTH